MEHSYFGCIKVDRCKGRRKCTLSPCLPLLLALIVFIFAAAPAYAQKPRYILTVTGNPDSGTSIFTQTLREKRTGRIIWVRHFPDARNVTWSKDHRAVAFQTGGSTQQDSVRFKTAFRFVIWKAGERVVSFFTWPAMLPLRDDYTEDFFWSPDKKHLLFRTGVSGDADIGQGSLWCLNVATHHVILIDDSVRRVRWTGPRRVKYRLLYIAPGHYLDPETRHEVHYGASAYESSKSRLWRVPKGF